MSGMMLSQAGASGPEISLFGLGDVIDVQIGSLALAGVNLESDGDFSESTSAGTTDTGDWVTPRSAASASYEARVTVNSGALTSGTTGTWLNLGTTRSWECSQGSVGTATANITIEIRRASGGDVLASATISLSAEYS